LNRRLTTLYVRRERLLAKAAAQREELALIAVAWKKPLALIDRGVAVGRYAQEHIAVVAIATAVVLVLSPRRTFRWARRGFALWRGYRWASRLLAHVAR
jgi:hypothetical protein